MPVANHPSTLLMTVLAVVVMIGPTAHAGDAANGHATGHVTWGAEVYAGAPVIPDRRVTITQEGQPDLSFTGRFRADAFDSPIDWDVRLIRFHGASGWALDFQHAKLILDSPPPGVQGFEMTHGYNLVSLQRLWERRRLVLMAGAGVVVAHPESTVRGLTFDSQAGQLGLGYYIAGPLAVIGAGKRLELGRRLYFSGDVRVSLSRASVPVVGGRARLTDFELHFLAGAGARF